MENRKGYRVQHITEGWEGTITKGRVRANIVEYYVEWDGGGEGWVA